MTRALVTGGSGEIGSAICRCLARDGLDVIVHANRNAERAERLAAELQAAGGSAEVAVFDVSSVRKVRSRQMRKTSANGCMPRAKTN